MQSRLRARCSCFASRCTSARGSIRGSRTPARGPGDCLRLAKAGAMARRRRRPGTFSMRHLIFGDCLRLAEAGAMARMKDRCAI